jgi:ATP-dependent Clp protease ATP-binding subunit ClpC
MFERFTESARRVLFFARYEASQFGATAIDTEHLLLGLTHEAKGLTCEIFALSRVSLKAIRRELEGKVGSTEQTPTSVEIPFSADAQGVLQYAIEESERLGHGYIGTEHILLGLLMMETGVAAATLAAQGLRLEDVRRELASMLQEPLSVQRPTRHGADALVQLDHIKHRIEELARTSNRPEERKNLEEILHHLEILRSRLSE